MVSGKYVVNMQLLWKLSEKKKVKLWRNSWVQQAGCQMIPDKRYIKLLVVMISHRHRIISAIMSKTNPKSKIK